MDFRDTEDLICNITLDYYNNIVYIHSYSDKYDNVIVNIYGNDNTLIMYITFTFIKNIKYWFKPNRQFDTLTELKIDIIYNEQTIKTEYFKLKNKHHILIKPVVINVLKSVTNGLGDIMSISPTIRKLYEIYNRKVILCIPTRANEFFITNPYVEYILNDDIIESDTSKYIIYYMYHSSIINKYYYSDLRQLCTQEIHTTLKDTESHLDFTPYPYEEIKELPDKYVCINPYIIGVDRSWEKDKWQKLVDLLNDNDIYVVTIGKDFGDYKPYHKLNIRLGVDLTGDKRQNNLSQTWHIINNSDLFISFDCSMYIFAGTTDVNILLLDWYGDPYYHQPIRFGKRDYKFNIVKGDCGLYCLTDPRYDINEHSNINFKRPVQECILNKNFVCKPTPEKTFEKVLEILRVDVL